MPKIIFKNTGEKSINDVIGEPLFDLNSYDFKFSVLPKTKYWRFGIRLSKSPEIIFSKTNRHGNTCFIDIHLGAGLPEKNEWKGAETLHFVQYHIPNLDHVISTCDKYLVQSMISFRIAYKSEKESLFLSYETSNCEQFHIEIKLSGFVFFKIFAWADNIAFELTCDWVVQKRQQKSNDEQRASLSKKKFLQYPPIKNNTGVIGVAELSAELADLIVRLPNEEGMMIGVFGKWGRGKTYLLDNIWSNLEKNTSHHFYKVNFHAWKYQDTPATWAYLYEVCADTYFAVSDGPRLFLRLKLNAYRMGYKILFNFLIYLTVSFISHHLLLLFLEKTLITYFLTYGLGLPISILHLYYSFKPEAIELFHDFTSKVSFKNYLGIQAEIQKELKFLFKAWIGSKKVNKRKVVLVVDDIDRCEESKIMQIIDSLRVMLEDKTIFDRVVVIAAIDEEVLKRAIRWKYASTLNAQFVNDKLEANKFQTIVDDKNAILEGLVREYMDKLFVCGIRLGMLGEAEIREIFSIMSDPYTKENQHLNSDSQGISGANEVSTKEKREGFNIQGVESVDQIGSTEIPTKDEFLMLEKFLVEAKGMTPRKLRIIFFRYILARNLLNMKYGEAENYWNSIEFCEDLPRLLVRFSSPEKLHEIEYEKNLAIEYADHSSLNSTCFEGMRIKEDYLKLLSVLETVIAY